MHSIGFMYSSARPLSLPLAAGLSAVSSIYKCTPLGRLTKGTSMEALSVPPLPRVTVAEAVIRAIEDPESAARHSPFEVADIVNIVEDHQFNTAP
ncbi:hypothetical protein EV182_008173 [Spiromyces aspiralis]|uniref:Uncharacterized protein n=1 Tax=Spiromyces aspiralis TaxID=68401 RepID=A0ACC1HC99_9FUNG|nr:hypothetical protein EV182_008173 [Spiromyces aspiralis]